ncbi:hypothetical protein SCHPADRAFT_947439 [Schizopora paradoxa]|uniref:Chromatin elongation factor SPT5 n=1 Tax=Schizopora paradoxa TaxID=27342 RepID=A0A0H2QYZ1_9AGAM|nr:hypothetical protein SCHPADRAFT_947439 [Schizopora paradoxa]
MGKRPFRSIFLDVEAVADEEDEEEEEEESGEDEYDEDIDNEDRLSNSTPFDFRIEDDVDAMAAFESFHRRAISRGQRRAPESVELATEVGTGNIPHPCDTAAVIPDVGKEITVVLRLMQKKFDQEALGLPVEGVGSVFTVSKSPGRIYVEARSPRHAEALLKGIHFIQLQSIYLVPLAERVALITPGMSPPPLQLGDHVTVRNGLYKGDVGEVEEISGDFKTALVKLKSRDTSVSSRNKLKRKRGRLDRPEPRVINKEDLRQRQACRAAAAKRNASLAVKDIRSLFVDHGQNGFSFNGAAYTNDGLILLRFRLDRLDKAQHLGSSSQNSASNFSLSHSPRLTGRDAPDRLPLDASTNLLEGNSVRVRRGESEGAKGRVLSISAIDTVTVQLTSHTTHPTDNIILELRRSDVERVFDLGEKVRVVSGEFVGFDGLVASTDVGAVHIVDIATGKEVETSPSSLISSHDIFTTDAAEALHYGDPVKIARGKHAGKTGRVRCTEGNHVRVVEDESLIEFFVRKDNVEIFGEPLHFRPPDSSTTRALIDARMPTRKPLVFRQPPSSAEIASIIASSSSTTSDPSSPSSSAVETAATPAPSSHTETDSHPTSVAPVSAVSVTCPIDHYSLGFEGQTVYVWHGPLKGRIGVVYRSGDQTTTVIFDSAMYGRSALELPSKFLVAKCGCIVDTGVALPWATKDIDNISRLFDRTVSSTNSLPRFFWEPNNPSPVSSLNGDSTPPRYEDEEPDDSQTSSVHDPSGVGMWLFHPRVAYVRRNHDIIVKILWHRESEISGRREGRVLSDPSALSHPIPSNVPATVLVKFIDAKQRVRVEHMSVSFLAPTSKLRDKGMHIVVKGPRMGSLVQHLKTERGMARVFAEGVRMEAFAIEKGKLCIVEEAV